MGATPWEAVVPWRVRRVLPAAPQLAELQGAQAEALAEASMAARVLQRQVGEQLAPGHPGVQREEPAAEAVLGCQEPQ